MKYYLKHKFSSNNIHGERYLVYKREIFLRFYMILAKIKASRVKLIRTKGGRVRII